MKPNRGLTGILCLLVILSVSAEANAPDQPAMRSARGNLQSAKSELMRAQHNKGGHRAKAIGFVNSAIGAVNRGIAFDRRNNHAVIPSRPADQPHMQAALTYLEDARRNLQSATSDKGGYRVQAIGFVDKAIEQVRLGIAAAR